MENENDEPGDEYITWEDVELPLDVTGREVGETEQELRDGADLSSAPRANDPNSPF